MRIETKIKIIGFVAKILDMKTVPGNANNLTIREKQIIPVNIRLTFRDISADTIRLASEKLITSEIVNALIKSNIIKIEVIDETEFTGNIIVNGTLDVVN